MHSGQLPGGTGPTRSGPCVGLVQGPRGLGPDRLPSRHLWGARTRRPFAGPRTRVRRVWSSTTQHVPAHFTRRPDVRVYGRS